MNGRCIGEPVSWLLLERHALGALSERERTEVSRHLDACAACKAAADSIAADEVRLLPLTVPVAKKPRRWAPRVWLFGPVLALAVMLLVIGLGREDVGQNGWQPAGVKGGAIVVELIRLHRGGLAEPTVFTPGDRFKAALTCAPGKKLVAEVAVYQDGEVFFPLPPATIACANRQLLPGAFRIDGGPAKVCVLAGEVPVDRDAPPALAEVPDARCQTVRPAP